MKLSLFTLGCLSLSACVQAEAPFDPAKCKLEVEARLSSSFREDAWRLEKNYYSGLLFSTIKGDVDLLDKYLKQKGYFSAAMDPDDPKSRDLRAYSSEGADEIRREMASPTTLSNVACDASYVSGVKLRAVWVMSGMEPQFKVEFK